MQLLAVICVFRQGHVIALEHEFAYVVLEQQFSQLGTHVLQQKDAAVRHTLLRLVEVPRIDDKVALLLGHQNNSRRRLEPAEIPSAHVRSDERAAVLPGKLLL